MTALPKFGDGTLAMTRPRYEDSPFDGFGKMTPPRTKRESPPPPWPLSADPRTSDCAHEWDGTWGDVGERQHQCLGCQRWIWEHTIPHRQRTEEGTE